MMTTKELEEDFKRTVVFPAVTPISKNQNIPLNILEKKIADLEYEAAVRMALDTFLDCSDVKVKVVKMRKPRPSELTWAGIRMRGSLFNTGRVNAAHGARNIQQSLEVK